MHMEAMIVRTLRPWSSEFGDEHGGHYRAVIGLLRIWVPCETIADAHADADAVPIEI